MKNVYLGDGAYAQIEDDGGIWITANHHDLTLCTDKVYLEPGALKLLVDQMNHYDSEDD